MRVWRCKQQSDLWLALRRGRITFSRLGDVLAAPTSRASSRGPKGTEAAEREKYRKELVAERITRRASTRYVTPAMQDGIEREPYARMLYEAETQQMVDQVGFVLHPEWDWFGGSPDGLVGDSGGIELKCPTELIHLSYIEDIDCFIEQYKWQCLGNFVCDQGRNWWDLVSFNPYFPDELKLIRTRLMRDDYADTLRQIEDGVQQMHAEIEAEIARLGLPPTVWDLPPQEEPPIEAYDPDKSFADNCAFLDDYEVIP